jgi:hypothetical protein
MLIIKNWMLDAVICDIIKIWMLDAVICDIIKNWMLDALGCNWFVLVMLLQLQGICIHLVQFVNNFISSFLTQHLNFI